MVRSSMAKKKSLLSLLKRLFISDTTTHLKPEKEKKRRWVFQRLKMKRLASLPPKEIALQDEAEDDEQSKHDLTTMAIPTVAEPEAAADFDAHVAAEVAGLNGKSSPQSFHKCEDKESQEAALAIRIQSGVLQSIHQFEKEIQELAAVKIQTAFRGQLARKALRALKGLVKLQAIIRGRAVRRQAINTLKCLQSIVSIQSQVCARRCELPEETCQCHENKQLQELRDKVMKIELSNHRRWDDSILTKQEANALFLSKKEAIMKRERIKEYALNYRKSTESDENKANGNLRYWLQQWVDTQLAKRKDLEDLDLALPSNPRLRDDHSRKQQNSNFFQKHEYRLEGLVSPISVPRRRSASFHQRKLQYNSISVDEPPGSPAVVFPTYMAATESAKAKTRSMSSPKLRPSSSSSASFDYFSEYNSPFKNKLSMGSPISTREVTSSGSGRIGTGKFDGYFHQRSPSLKSIPGLVKSTRTIKDLSFDSDCSLLNWDRHSTFRLS